MGNAPRQLPDRVQAALDGVAFEGNPTSDTYEDLYRAFEAFNSTLFDGALEPVLLSIRAGKELGYFKANCFRHSDSRRQFAHEIALNPEQFGLHSIEMCLANLVRQMVHQLQYQEETRGRRGYENKDFVGRMERIGITVRKEEEGGGKGVYKEKHDDLLIHPDGPFMRVARQLIDAGFRARWADRFIESMRQEYAAQQATRAEPEVGQQGLRSVEATGDQVATGEGEGRQEEEGSKAPGSAAAEAVVPGVVGPVGDPACERAPGSSVPPISEGALEFLSPPKPRDSKHKFQCPLCKASAWGKTSLHLVCGACRVYMKRAEADGSHLDPKGVVRFRVGWEDGDAPGEAEAQDVAQAG